MNDASFEIGTWGLSWNDANSNEAVLGIASFSSAQGAVLDVPYGSVLDSGFELRGDNHAQADYVFGVTRNNEYLVLANCDVQNATYRFPGVERQLLRGEYLMASSTQFDPCSPIICVFVKLKGLLEWSNIRLVHEEISWDANSHFLKRTAILDAASLEPHVLYSCEEYKIELVFSSKVGKDSILETIFENAARIQISFSDSINLIEMLPILHEIQSFVSFCAGWYASIEAVSLKTAEGCSVGYYARYVEDSRALKQDDFVHMPLPYS